MTIIESIILGAVQGLTEFLPVSSSGHLQIAKALLGVEIEENLAFDTTLHAATVLSTIVILWPEVKRFDNPHKYYVDLSDKLWNIQHELLEKSQEVK